MSREQNPGGGGIPAREDGGQEWPPHQPKQRNIWRDGLWIGAVALLIVTIGALYQTWLHLGPQGREQRAELKGNGVDVPSYGFDLSKLAEGVNPNEIHATKFRRGEVPILIDPEQISADENSQLKGHEKYVVPTDRIIGVKSYYSGPRAYPIQVMQVHQVVNDVLSDGEPETIAYDPLSEIVRVFSAGTYDHSAAFDIFGVSGLSYKGQSLLYKAKQGNRAKRETSVGEVEEADQYLYWPLSGQSITASHDGDQEIGLDIFGEVSIMQWRDWLAMYPNTTVMKRDEKYLEQYKEDTYGPYYQSGALPGPVQPQLSSKQFATLGLGNKSRGIGLIDGASKDSKFIFIPYEVILANGNLMPDGLREWNLALKQFKIKLRARPADVGFTPQTGWIVNQSGLTYDHGVDVVPMVFWFAWYATHPDTRLLGQDGKLVKP